MNNPLGRKLFGSDFDTSGDELNLIHKYPNIRDVATRMALDNGVVNRQEPVADFYTSCDPVLASCDEADLKALEMWLDTMTEEQADTLADGEEKEREQLLQTCPQVGGDPASPPIAKLFDDIFEVM